MSEKFLGQIMMVGFNFAPKNFAFCNGQLLSIQQNTALFSLLGVYYGGNGTTNFQLPDLRSRTPVGYASSVDPGWPGANLQPGERGGVESVTLTQAQLPAHVHNVSASTAAGNNRLPTARIFAQSTASANAPALYAPSSGALVAMNPNTVATAGGTQPHSNLQPYTALNFCIALAGIFPSRN